MIAVVQPQKLRGHVEIPSSKSCVHRLLIAAALADAPTAIAMNAVNADILATADCLQALGANISRTQQGFLVTPIAKKSHEAIHLDCGESGSTLRFLIPIVAALGIGATFFGKGRLPERPNAVLIQAINAHNAQADSDFLPMHLSGRLCGGRYEITGNVSSQYITGLLMALPLCEEDSEIILTTPLESASYIDLTTDVLQSFGIRTLRTAQGWTIPGRQRYTSPKQISAEGDWSGAAFWLVANHIGSQVSCEGLSATSRQGDRAISEMLNRLGGEIDVSNTPDLVPALSVAAALHPGTTHLTGAARLRIKESDRLHTVAEMLKTLGVSVEEREDSLVIHGVAQFSGGTIQGCNDHRIVMAAAIAASAASAPIVITDAEAVNKSYPHFFEEFTRLGGIVHVESNR